VQHYPDVLRVPETRDLRRESVRPEVQMISVAVAAGKVQR
jgi:hypothetical protein